mmetsp:Transcript_31423/g.72265  ORF Transcript_31423/g.72265 Transcript_31423/m.72265 type:complete len:266 (-) Transcript_31423:937-1734(-)
MPQAQSASWWRQALYRTRTRVRQQHHLTTMEQWAAEAVARTAPVQLQAAPRLTAVFRRRACRGPRPDCGCGCGLFGHVGTPDHAREQGTGIGTLPFHGGEQLRGQTVRRPRESYGICSHAGSHDRVDRASPMPAAGQNERSIQTLREALGSCCPGHACDCGHDRGHYHGDRGESLASRVRAHWIAHGHAFPCHRRHPCRLLPHLCHDFRDLAHGVSLAPRLALHAPCRASHAPLCERPPPFGDGTRVRASHGPPFHVVPAAHGRR